MRHRIREQALVDYQVARSNSSWWEHQARTYATAGLMAWLKPDSVLDPACGDGSLVLAAHKLEPIKSADLIDISVPSIDALDLPNLGWSAQAEDAVEYLERHVSLGTHWDLVVLTEFLEHVPDPDAILRQARKVATYVVASSPLLINPHDDDSNPEHLWAFDNQGYLEMLMDAGWTPKVCQNLMLHGGHYNFQIWVCN